jgi:uncharacterized membrane protein YcaP (DUF421 family)
MLVVFLRSVILYGLVLVVIRLMGKRQIGELQPFELVITIMIAEFAATPIENSDIPLINGIIPIMTLLFLETLLSVVMLKSETARKFIDGKPSIIMNKGKLNYKELKKQRININDLLEHLRIDGYHNLHELEYIIIEPDGQLSVISKPDYNPLTARDMNIQTEPVGIPISLIIDGRRNYKNMELANCNNKWLDNQLKVQGYSKDKDVLLAYIDSKKNLYVQSKEERG